MVWKMKRGILKQRCPVFLIPCLFLPLILIHLIVCIIIFVAAAIELDADAQHDERKTEDANTQVEEHVVPEDRREFDTRDRDQHFRRGSCGRRGAGLNFGASHA